MDIYEIPLASKAYGSKTKARIGRVSMKTKITVYCGKCESTFSYILDRHCTLKEIGDSVEKRDAATACRECKLPMLTIGWNLIEEKLETEKRKCE